MSAAKLLSPEAQRRVLAYLATNRPATLPRDRLLMLLSWQAGLRVCEIAGLEWPDVLEPTGELSCTLRVRRLTTKGRRHTRHVPLHPGLQEALLLWRHHSPT